MPKKDTSIQTAVQIVDSLLFDAVTHAASDIHLEPMQDNLRVRFRIDGVLLDQEPIERDLMTQVIARLKVLAHMDIAEKRRPQDGKFRLPKNNQLIDLRLSTFPSLYGEKMVVRILDRAIHMMDLDRLGFDVETLAQFKKLMQRNSGLFLVTGPTGSGKTTTLYSALSMINSPEKNIVTLEDPVEYSIDGITQAQINPAAGFTFEEGMRSILRQDPDVIMVGEIRDKQTARIAIEAALTGHLVLSTLHTNDAPSAIMRLMDMGIEPYLINASLSGVLGQRLTRKICEQCREKKEVTDENRRLINRLNSSIDQLYHGMGCKTCDFLGYKGRAGIFELLEVSHQLRSRIVSQPIFDDIYKQARVDGMRSFHADGIQKIKDGVISLNELVRVVM